MTFLKIIALILSLNLSPSYAEQTKGQIWSTVNSWYRPRKGDGLKTIKKRLLYRAFDQAISIQLKRKSRDPKLFFAKFKEKLQLSIQDEEDEFKKRIGYTEDVKGSAKRKLDDRVERFQFAKSLKFANLYRSVISYKILKQWRDDRERSIQRMRVKVQVDLPSLLVVYARVLEENAGKQSGEETLYVRLNYKTEGFQWDDLNFSDEEDFHNSLVEAWVKWLRKDFESKNKEIAVFKYTDFYASKLRKDDALLDMHIRIKKEILEKDFKQFVFRYWVDFSVLSHDDQLLYAGKLRTERKEITQTAADKVPNVLANTLYRVPLSDFAYIQGALERGLQRKNKDKIIVKSFKSLKQIDELIKFLNSYGAEIKLKSEIASLSSSEVTVNLFYQGDQQKLLKVVEYVAQNAISFQLMSKEFPLSVKF